MTVQDMGHTGYNVHIGYKTLQTLPHKKRQDAMGTEACHWYTDNDTTDHSKGGSAF